MKFSYEVGGQAYENDWHVPHCGDFHDRVCVAYDPENPVLSTCVDNMYPKECQEYLKTTLS